MLERRETRNSLHCIYRDISQKTDEGCNVTLYMEQFKVLHQKDTGPYRQWILLCFSVLSSFLKLGYAA